MARLTTWGRRSDNVAIYWLARLYKMSIMPICNYYMMMLIANGIIANKIL